MKVAICISGLIRDFNKSSLIDFISRLPSKPDIFITTWDIRYSHIPLEHVDNQIIELSTFDGLNAKEIEIKKWDGLGLNHHHNKNMDILTFEKKSKYENDNNFKYDIVYKSRFDIEYYGELYSEIKINNDVFMPLCIPFIGESELIIFKNSNKIDIDFYIEKWYNEENIIPENYRNGCNYWDDYPHGNIYFTSSDNIDKIRECFRNNMNNEDIHYLLKNTNLNFKKFNRGFAYLKNYRKIN